MNRPLPLYDAIKNFFTLSQQEMDFLIQDYNFIPVMGIKNYETLVPRETPNLFNELGTDSYRILFTKKPYFFTIDYTPFDYHNSYSLNFTIHIDDTASNDKVSLPLSKLFALQGHPQIETLFYQVNDKRRLHKLLSTISNYMKLYNVIDFLESNIIEILDIITKENSDKKILLAQHDYDQNVRAAVTNAREALNKKKYKDVIELLCNFEDKLLPHEKKILDIAYIKLRD